MPNTSDISHSLYYMRWGKIPYAFAYGFAASAVSEARCFHEEMPWAPAYLGPGPKPLSKHFAAEAAEAPAVAAKT